VRVRVRVEDQVRAQNILPQFGEIGFARQPKHPVQPQLSFYRTGREQTGRTAYFRMERNEITEPVNLAS
jgi:hypothetical protein